MLLCVNTVYTYRFQETISILPRWKHLHPSDYTFRKAWPSENSKDFLIVEASSQVVPSNRVNLLAISSAASSVLEVVQSKLTETECCNLFACSLRLCKKSTFSMSFAPLSANNFKRPRSGARSNQTMIDSLV